MTHRHDFEEEPDELNNRPLIVAAIISLIACLFAAWANGQL